MGVKKGVAVTGVKQAVWCIRCKGITLVIPQLMNSLGDDYL